MNPFKEARAVCWAWPHSAPPGRSKWHITTNSKDTLCGTQIDLAAGVKHADIEVVECKRCLAVVEALNRRFGGAPEDKRET